MVKVVHIVNGVAQTVGFFSNTGQAEEKIAFWRSIDRDMGKYLVRPAK